VSKISELSDGGSLVSSDYLIAVRSGGNVKVRMDQINVDQVDLGDNEFIRLGNSQDLTMVHTSTQSIINQAGIGDLLIQKAGATKLTINASGIDVAGSGTFSSTAAEVAKFTSSDVGTTITLNNTHANAWGSNIAFQTGGTPAGFVGPIGSLIGSTDQTLAVYGAAGNGVGIYTNGNNERVRVTSAGNVGIGTASPNGNGILTLNTPADNSAQIVFAENDTAKWLIGHRHDGDYFRFYDLANSAERMRIDSSGNVGIGNSSAAGKLEVYANNTAPAAYIRQDGTGPIQSWHVAAGAEKMRLDANGVLQSNGYSVVASSARPASGTLRLGNIPSTSMLLDYDDQGQTIATVRNQYGTTDATAELSLDSGFITFNTGTSFTEAMRIDASGNLLVNDTGVSGNAEKFRITSGGTSSATAAALFNNSAGTELFFVRSDGAFRTGSAAVSPYNNTAAVTANCFINTDGTLLRATSSRRYKKDISDARFGLSDLLKLRPVNYKGINSEVDGDIVYGGLIAEEVHDAGLTEFVEYNKENQPDALRYQHMVSLCIKAIQEQQATIEALTARIAALES